MHRHMDSVQYKDAMYLKQYGGLAMSLNTNENHQRKLFLPLTDSARLLSLVVSRTLHWMSKALRTELSQISSRIRRDLGEQKRNS